MDLLGPKLFIASIKGICNASKVWTILFASDTNLFHRRYDLGEMIRKTNGELHKFHVWFAVNRRSRIVTKTNK